MRGINKVILVGVLKSRVSTSTGKLRLDVSANEKGDALVCHAVQNVSTVLAAKYGSVVYVEGRLERSGNPPEQVVLADVFKIVRGC